MRHPAPFRPLSIAALLLAPVLVRAQSSYPAATAPAPAAALAGPQVGQPAPDFTAAWADGSGPRATPVSLSALRGKVVVIAFYPSTSVRTVFLIGKDGNGAWREMKFNALNEESYTALAAAVAMARGV